jgi:hypothetical protein
MALLGEVCQLSRQAQAIEGGMEIQGPGGDDGAQPAQREGQILEVFESHVRQFHDRCADLTSGRLHADRVGRLAAQGRRSSKVLPTPHLTIHGDVPPWRSATVLTMSRPRPTPEGWSRPSSTIR